MVAQAVQSLVIQYGYDRLDRRWSLFGNDLLPICPYLIHFFMVRHGGEDQNNYQDHEQNHAFSHHKVFYNGLSNFDRAKIANKKAGPPNVCMNGSFLCIIGFLPPFKFFMRPWAYPKSGLFP